MEFPLNGFAGNAVLKNGPQEIAAATQPQFRLLRFGRKASDYESCGVGCELRALLARRRRRSFLLRLTSLRGIW